MDTWARGTKADREALFNETATRMGISPEIVEKDFWVCWILRHVFQMQRLPRIIFKGGTSLSKAFGIIKRFSEDVDLVINRHELGFDEENDPANQEGTNLRNRTIDNLKAACGSTIKDVFLPTLEKQVQSVINDASGWSLQLDTTAPDSDAIEFKYPKGISDSIATGYIKRVVRLELGCRGDQIPCESSVVTPYAADIFPEQFKISSINVQALSPERTFWEKATALHREYYRVQSGKPITERSFRHYHDVVVLAKHQRGIAAMKGLDLLAQVVSHKQHFFREASARYELAKKGTLRLAPDAKLAEELRKDFLKMREMFFGAHPDFDEVIREIRKIETLINEN